MKLLSKTTVNGKQFSISDSEGTVYPKQLGLADNWYGGYVKELRKTKYGIYLCLTKKGEIVNLGYTDESLTDEGRELLGMESLPLEPVEEPETDISKLERKDLIALAKKLGVEGKVATIKSVDLITAINEKLK